MKTTGTRSAGIERSSPAACSATVAHGLAGQGRARPAPSGWIGTVLRFLTGGERPITREGWYRCACAARHWRAAWSGMRLTATVPHRGVLTRDIGPICLAVQIGEDE